MYSETVIIPDDRDTFLVAVTQKTVMAKKWKTACTTLDLVSSTFMKMNISFSSMYCNCYPSIVFPKSFELNKKPVCGIVSLLQVTPYIKGVMN